MSARRISDEAMAKATGHGSEHWFPLLDELAEDGKLTRTEIVMTLWRNHESDLSPWWAQMTTVEWERERGRRNLNQSCAGDYQVGVQKSFPGDVEAAWNAVVSANWLDGLKFEEGYNFDIGSTKCTVRAVRPGKMLRIWFQEEGHKTVLEVMFVPTKDKCAIRFRHHQLAEELDVEINRSRWKTALAEILS